MLKRKNITREGKLQLKAEEVSSPLNY